MPPLEKNSLRERLLPSAEFEVKWFILKDKIQKKEKLTFSEEEMNELAAKDSEKTGISVDKLLNYYKTSRIPEKMVDKKLFEFLTNNNTISKVSPENLKQIKLSMRLTNSSITKKENTNKFSLDDLKSKFSK